MSNHNDDGFGIIDAHFHIWDPTIQRLPWLDDADPLLNRKWDLADLERAYASFDAESVRFLGGVYVEVDCDSPEAEDRLIYSNHDPRILARVMRARMEPWMRIPLFADGVRDPLHIPSSRPGRCLDSDFIDGLRMLGAAGLPFDVCARIDELDDIAQAHEQAPDTVIVLDHMGNVTPERFTEQYRDAMRRLAQLPNTYVKVSGYPTSDIKFVHDVLAFSREVFPNRRMYASNWPVVESYANFNDHLRLLLAEEGYDESLFCTTAAQVYHIDTASLISPTHTNTTKETAWEPSLKACFALLSR